MTDEELIEPRSTKVVYHYYEHDAHAGKFMRTQAERLGFRILTAEPQALYDRWVFTLDATEQQMAGLDAALREEHLSSQAHRVFCNEKCGAKP